MGSLLVIISTSITVFFGVLWYGHRQSERRMERYERRRAFTNPPEQWRHYDGYWKVAHLGDLLAQKRQKTDQQINDLWEVRRLTQDYTNIDRRKAWDERARYVA